MQPWIEQFVDTIPHLEKKTSQGYSKALADFVTYLDKVPEGKCFPSTIKCVTIEKWAKQSRKRYSFHTVRGMLRIANHFLSFLEARGILRENPLRRLQEQYPAKGFSGIVRALLSSSPKKSLQALKMPDTFISPLGPHMKNYIALGRAQGKKYRNEEEILLRFDRFLISYPRPPRKLSDAVIRKWISLFHCNVRANRYLTFGVIQRFCLYLRRLDAEAYVPDSSLTPPVPTISLPYIYSRREIRSLVKAARHLKPSKVSPIRPQMVSCLVLLLYTTGMRLGEALKLQLGDIDWKHHTLVVRETKFFKTRLVPLSSSMMKELKGYIECRQACGLSTSETSFLFQNPHRRGHFSKTGARSIFLKLLQEVGCKPVPGTRKPCIHSLRHTMAVHRLEDWYQRGENVQAKLGLLSTYLGHVNIAATQRYLTMTPELLQQASMRFHNYAQQEDSHEKG